MRSGRALALAAAPAVLVLASCDGGTGSTGPGGVSEGEARALDEAAEMLEQRRLPEGALPETAPPGAAETSEQTAQEAPDSE